jgi:hypothetical protein
MKAVGEFEDFSVVVSLGPGRDTATDSRDSGCVFKDGAD